MAVSIVSDFKIYEDEFNAGLFEALYENSLIFNAASGGSIVLVNDVHPGHYQKQAYFDRITDLIVRQDITSNATAVAKKLTQSEEVQVKLHRRMGPVQTTLKAFKMAGLEAPAGSLALGRLVGDAFLQRMANTAIISSVAAIVGQGTDLTYDVTGNTPPEDLPTFKHLNRTRGKWGDQMAKLRSWLMHSDKWLDLIDKGLDTSLEMIAGVLTVRGQIPGLMGARPLISDNANLVNSGTPDTYNVLGLAPGAVMLKMSELQTIVFKVLTGQEQLYVEWQGEYAETIGIDGFAWDIANGGSNPDDTALGTSTNWDKVRSDAKGLGLVRLLSN